MRKLLTPIGLLLALPAVGSSAVASPLVAVGMTGGITVYNDLGACARLDFDHAVTGVGQFISAGAVYGPGATTAAPVRGATPIVLVGRLSWYGCLPDAYAGAQEGYATYQVSVSTSGGDFVEVLVCEVGVGAVSCR